MTDEHFEELAKRYPALFEKSKCEFSIGPGWYNIIRVLCGFIYRDVDDINRRIEYVQSRKDASEKGAQISDLMAELELAKKELPVIVQVKEKFGSLRFYADNVSPEMYSYINFAEAMSGVTCEDCGAPGKARTGGWIRTLCDEHYAERYKVKDDNQ